MIQAPIRSGHLASLAEVVRAICELPAVATYDWCDRAASCLSVLRPQAVVCLTLGEIDAEGNVLRVEASGSHPSRGRVELLAGRRNLGWTLTDSGGYARLLREVQSIARFLDSPAGRRWAELGVSDLIVGMTPIGPDQGGRQLVVEVGTMHGTSNFDRGELAVVSAAMGELCRRARLAFGDQPSDPMHRLTRREQIILEQLALGQTVKQIAEQMARSPHTIHDHVKSMHRKLQVKSRGELIARALGHLGAPPTPTMGHDDHTAADDLDAAPVGLARTA